MPARAKVAVPQETRPKRALRFSSVEQFLAEYNKGSQLPIDLDPRIDFTKPVFEQVVALRAKDRAIEEHPGKRKRHTKSQ